MPPRCMSCLDCSSSLAIWAMCLSYSWMRASKWVSSLTASPMTVLQQRGSSSRCLWACPRLTAALRGSTIPSSDSRPRMRVLMGTQHILGRVSASHNAAASAALFLPRLAAHAIRCDKLRCHQAHRAAELRQTFWPSGGRRCRLPCRSGRVDHGQPVQAVLARGTSGRVSSTLPASPAPCTVKAFFARSMSTVTIVTISPIWRVDQNFAAPTFALYCRKPQLSQSAGRWTREVSFIRRHHKT